MRTYTRKRTEYQLIDDVNEKCRLCLGKLNESVPIFTETDNVCNSLTMRIMMCVGLEISREECLPDMICAECHKELNNYYEFKKKCVLSYQKLKSHVLAFKQSAVRKENNEKSNVPTEKLETNGNVEPLNNIVFMEQPQVTLNDLNINNLSSLCNGDNIDRPSTESSSMLDVQQDMTGFVFSVLVELGIMTKHEDQLIVTDESVRTIEVEANDETITFEIMEINEELENGLIDDTNDNINNIYTSIEHIESCDNNKSAQQQNSAQSKESGAQCAACSKRFASRSALRRHALVHSGARPHACAVCRRAFAQREVLRRHELVHSAERPFKCSSCAKSFTQRGALAAHARSHAAPAARALALHRCERCPKVFLYASGLSRHTMLHNGRVFSCAVCQRRFSDRSSLLRHERAKHRARDE